MKRDEVLRLLAKHRVELDERGVRSLKLFGSVARDEAGPDSDVDLLVEFSKPVGLFELVDIQEYMQDLLGCPVDLATAEGLKPRVRDTVMKELVTAL